VHNTPFGDINDVEDDLQPLTFATFSEARRAIRLLSGAIGAIEVDRDALRKKAAGSFLTMTELADTLVREEGLSFKAAHRLVAHTVRRVSGVDAPHSEIADALMAVAQESLGRPLHTPRTKLVEALSPMHFVEVRQVIGGPAPNQVSDFLKRQKQIAGEDGRWAREKANLLATFPQKIEREKWRLVGTGR